MTVPNWQSHSPIQKALAQDDAILTLYIITLPNEKASQVESYAQKIANGQSIGTQVPEEMARLAPYCASVLWVGEAVALNSSEVQVPFVLSFPKSILMWDFGMLLTVCFGKVSMMPNLRWVDLAVPLSVAEHFQGPAMGQEGIRQRVQVPEGKPLLMSIFKPCVGVDPHDLAAMLRIQAQAGIHCVKDDEVLADASIEVAVNRVRICMQALNQAENDFGHRPLYAVNLNAPAHQLLDRAERLLEEGVEMFLFNYLAYGFPLLHALREKLNGRAFIMGHPALGGAFYHSPQTEAKTGMSPTLVFGTLPRLAGADAVLFPSPYGTVALPLEEAIAVQDALNTPYLPVRPAFGVPSAGIQASMVPQILADFGTNVIINAGTGIHEGEGGSLAGVRRFQSAIETTLAQTTFEGIG